MKRSLELISPDKAVIPSTDWGKCFVCQENVDTKISHPYLVKGELMS